MSNDGSKNINEKLFKAIFSLKDISLAKEIIKNEKVDINCYDQYGRQYIHYAAEYNLTDLVVLLIEKGADVNAKSIETHLGETTHTKNSTPLHFLAKNYYCKHDKTAKLLIEKGADVNCLDAYGRPPLLVLENNAVHKKLALLFINKGADINAVDQRGENLLSSQIYNASLDFVKELINKGIDLSGNAGVMALCKAIHHHNIDYVRLLLEHGVNISPIEEYCPLAYAARKGDLASFNLLIEYGAEPEKNTREILVDLFFGGANNIEIAQTILKISTKNGIKFDEKNANLINLAASNNAWWAIKTLVELGADVNNRDSDGSEPIVYAAIHDHTEAIEELIKANADLSGDAGTRALICIDKIRNLQLLIDGGANVNEFDDGRTPLQFAVSKLQYKKIKTLLENGANPNIVGDQLEPPLKIAVKKGRTDIIQLLLLHGADKNIKIDAKTTIADVAEKSKDAGLAALFKMDEEELKSNKIERSYLRFANKHLLFADGPENWNPVIQSQIKKIFGKMPLNIIEEEAGEIEYFDVVTEIGKPLYQLVLFNYGDGALFAYNKTSVVGEIIQHGFDVYNPMSEDAENELRNMLDDAYRNFEGKIWQSVNFTE